MYIFGAGNFGRETLDALRDLGISAEGFLSDVEPERPVSIPLLLPAEGWQAQPTGVVIAVSNPQDREVIANRLTDLAWTFESVVHPRSATGSGVAMGHGAVVLAMSYVSTDTAISNHVHINYGVTIGHDCIIGDYATILPNATIGGGVTIGKGATVGSGSVILPKLQIGEGSTVGAGAVVTHDVPPNPVVVGNPARPHQPAG